MIDLWLPPKPAIIIPHREIQKASFLPGMFPAGAAALAAAGSFPVVQATNTGASGFSMSSYAVPLPASIQSGELLLIFIAVNASRTLTTPSGWTQRFNTNSGTTRFACYYKVATGSEGSTISVMASGSADWATNSYRVSNYQGTPESGTSATGTSTAPNPPSLTPTWGSAKTLWLAGMANASSSAVTNPSNYTNQVTVAVSSLMRTTTARLELESTSEDPGTFTITSAAWIANTVAVQPA